MALVHGYVLWIQNQGKTQMKISHMCDQFLSEIGFSN